MKKAFAVILKSKDTEVSDAKLKTAIKDAVVGVMEEDVRVTVARVKELDPVK